MSDIREMRVFSADQITMPDSLPLILKELSKEVILKNPQNIPQFAKEHFKSKLREQGYTDADFEKMEQKVE